jgi:hypothetical protein
MNDRLRLIISYLLLANVLCPHACAQPQHAIGLKSSPPLIIVGQTNVLLSALQITNVQGSGITLRHCRNVRIENCHIGPCAGEAVSVEECEGITLYSNRFEKVRTGVYALNSRRVSVTHNRCRNIQGPMPRGQFAQFDKISGPGNSISHNSCQNTLGESNPEDIINLYQSSGTPEEPIQVVGNRIRGGGPSASGGGIMLGDAGGSYILVKDNLLVDPGQYGIAVAGGDHIQVINNKLFGRARPFTNVGFYIWNQYSPPCHDHLIKGNQVRWSDRNGANNPFWNAGNCSSVQICDDNDWHAALDDSLLPASLF